MSNIDISNIVVTISVTKYIDPTTISGERFNIVDISDNINEEYPSGNPEFIALSNLREYKNREGNLGYEIINGQFYRTREGRETGNNIDFTQVANDGTIMNYEVRKTRRKAEILQYNRNDKLNRKQIFKNNVTSKQSNRLSLYQLKLLSKKTDISNCVYNNTKTSCSSIIYNPNVSIQKTSNINGGGL